MLAYSLLLFLSSQLLITFMTVLQAQLKFLQWIKKPLAQLFLPIPTIQTVPVNPAIDKEEVVKLISQVSEDRLENIQESLKSTLEQKLHSVEERLQERLETLQKLKRIRECATTESLQLICYRKRHLKPWNRLWRDLKRSLKIWKSKLKTYKRNSAKWGQESHSQGRANCSSESVSVSVPLKVGNICARGH